MSAKKAATGTAATEKAPEPGSEESAKSVEAAQPAKKGSTARGAKPGEKAEAGKAQTASPEGAAEEGGSGAGRGKGGRSVQLKMPEPPSDLTPAARQRVQKVKASAGQAAASHAALPSAPESVKQARTAVTEPQQEANAHAGADLVDALGQRPKPSPQIEAICAEIRLVIEEKRPPDEKSLVKADPEQMGQEAGDKVKGNVQGDVKRVDQSYDSLEKTPTGTPQQGQPLEALPASAPVPAMNASHAAPDSVPAQNVSLNQDSEDAKARMGEAGMNKAPAKLVQTGPVAEARAAQGELEKTAAEDPAKVLAAQQASLSKASADMAALQQQALNALATSRSKTVSGTTGQQKQMVGSEEQKRTQVSAQAQAIFTGAQTRVNGLLQTLPQTAMQKWDAGITIAKRQFKQELKTVEEWIEKRHESILVSFADRLFGLPPWVTAKYNIAEKNFGNDVCNLAREISIEVNGIIMTCEAIIADARTKIANLFASLPESLQAWAAGEQAKLGAQLDTLQNHAHEVRDNFDRELVGRAAQSVQEVREEIHALREKAKGFLGRLADAIDRFAQDPAKFILEGLLDLLGIPPASFWAVVAKIQKVIGDIADDPEKFANNLMAAVGKGFTQFFDNILDHLLHGFLDWLTGGLAAAGVTLPKDLSLKSIITFVLELMGITWPRIRKLLAKHIGEENVALLEKAYSIVANLVALGPEGIFEMIKEKLNPQEILDQIIKAAVDYMMSAIIKAVSARILLLFNPVGAILQAIEAIYKVLKWIFTNAARIFRLIETIVNGIADIIAGNIGGMANAVEKALAGLIAPVIDFLADYLGFGDLPNKVKETILGFQAWIEGILDQVIGWLVEKGKALLKAVGLGGKEGEKKPDEGEVGESVAFTAGGEQHRLWIAVKGGNAVIMLASGAAALLDFLNSERVQKAVDSDDQKPADKKIKDKVPRARELANEADVDAEKVLSFMSGQKEDEATQENKKVKTVEHQLANLLTDILGAISKDGLTIFDVIGKPIDPLPEQPKPEGYVFVISHGFKELQRAAGRGKEGPEQYPQVHVDEVGIVKSGAGILRYDYDLVKRYNAALTRAKLDGDEAPGNPEMPVNMLVSGANKPPHFNEGIRAQMEQLIREVDGGQNVTGVEVMLGRKRIDYTITVDRGEGVENALVEYKHWTGNLKDERRAELAAKLLTQLTAYVDHARTGGNDYRRLIIAWPAFSRLDATSQAAFNNVFEAVKKHSDSKPANEKVTIEIKN